jgi:hypothetical protein
MNDELRAQSSLPPNNHPNNQLAQFYHALPSSLSFYKLYAKNAYKLS